MAFPVIALTAVAVGFALVIILASQTKIALAGDLRRTWNTPYDILVRNSNSTTTIERSEGLVRPNFISGLRGGITDSQLAAIRAVHGVKVAAPVAPVGFVLWPSAIVEPVDATMRRSGTSILRVSVRATGDAGLSTYPIDTRYLIVAQDGELDLSSRILTANDDWVTCWGHTNCFAGRVCRDGTCERGAWPSVADARYYLPLLQPIAIAGIDPEAEAQMAGIAGCMVDGRYLAEDDGPSDLPTDDGGIETIPVIVADHTFVDQELTVDIAEPTGPPGQLDPGKVAEWRTVGSRAYSVDELYRNFIPSLRDYQDPWPILRPGEVAYQSIASRHLTVVAPAQSSEPAPVSLETEYDVPKDVLLPPEQGDTPMRPVTTQANVVFPGPGSAYRWKAWQVEGTYSPSCLPGFDPLAGGPLESYSVPSVTLANGTQLSPNRSLSGYVNSPPLVLTTLASARWLSDPKRYAGQPGAAYIGVVRVVTDTPSEPSQDAYAYLAGIAEKIERATGLRADIVKGASPEPIRVDLPAGKYGRPALTVAEGWTVKGVTVHQEASVSAEDRGFAIIAILLLIGMSGIVFWITAASRQAELVTLRAIGWRTTDLERMLQSEVALICAASTVLAAAATAAIGTLVSLSWLPTVAAGVSSGLLGAAATFGVRWSPALRRSAPAVGGSRSVRAPEQLLGLRSVAQTELMCGERLPMAIIGVAIAGSLCLVGALTAVSAGFRNQLGQTALEVQLGITANAFHWALAAVAVASCFITIHLVVHIAYGRKRESLRVIRWCGWGTRELRFFVFVQTCVLTLVAGAIPAALYIAATIAAHEPIVGVATAAFVMMGAGVAVYLAALRAVSDITKRSRHSVFPGTLRRVRR